MALADYYYSSRLQTQCDKNDALEWTMLMEWRSIKDNVPQCHEFVVVSVAVVYVIGSNGSSVFLCVRIATRITDMMLSSGVEMLPTLRLFMACLCHLHRTLSHFFVLKSSLTLDTRRPFVVDKYVCLAVQVNYGIIPRPVKREHISSHFRAVNKHKFLWYKK